MTTMQQEEKKGDKTLTGDAGAHYVAFRLAVMGYAVGLTTHGTRAIDLVVANPDTGKSVTIQTKTMRKASGKSDKWKESWHKWFAGKSQRSKHKTFFYAFVDLRGGHPNTPELYIVPSLQVDSLRDKEYPDWYVIYDKDEKKYKEKWDAIESELA